MSDLNRKARIEDGHDLAVGMPYVTVEYGTGGNPVIEVDRKSFVTFAPRRDAMDPVTGERYLYIIVLWNPSEADTEALVHDETSPFFATRGCWGNSDWASPSRRESAFTSRRGGDVRGTEWSAERVLAELTPRMRMRVLFDTAKAATGIAPAELETLFAEPSYEARMAAFCILDFQARKRLGDLGLRDTYLRHHDRIDDWGMVDRAAPRVIGATLTGGPYDLLHELAASSDPHRRRTAMTAPLWFVKYGNHTDVEAGIMIAEVLHADLDPLVHKPVGIYLAYAGERLPERLTEFLDQHGKAMPRAAYRIAIRKRRPAGDG